jgi:chaperonin cofactor prefoldin
MLLERKPQPPTLEELQRELEVLRNKLQALSLAHVRIEREAQRLMDQFEVVRSTIQSKAPRASNPGYRAAG